MTTPDQSTDARERSGRKAQLSSGPEVDAVELEAQRAYLRRQIEILSRRHPPEEIILLRVLADFHAHVVRQAKQGAVAKARSEMNAARAVGIPDDDELRAVHDTTALPSQALISWLEKRSEEAILQLRSAICACSDLATKYGHDYLTGRRIHLAANIARVLAEDGLTEACIASVTALRGVVSGDRSQWPYEAGESLDIPLRGAERVGLEYQLRRIAAIGVKKTAASGITTA